MEEKKKQRVIMRIGDVFCVEVDNEYKSYFQYIAKDTSQLNSSVIRVFKKRYGIDYVPILEDIVNDDVFFYAHTVIRLGLKIGAWYKVGSCKEVGNTTDIMFSLFDDMNFSHKTKSYNWYIWKINQESVFIGEMKDEYRHYDRGWIYSWESIINKIKTGQFLMRDLE